MGQSQTRHLIPVRSEALQPGMYVAELDRSWLHAPFPTTGFLITQEAQIRQLQQLCHHVYIDTALSEELLSGQAGNDRSGLADGRGRRHDRMTAARQVLADIRVAMGTITRQARAGGRIDAGLVAHCGELLATSVGTDDNGVTLHYCLRILEDGSFLGRRAAGTAVAATLLARQLGADHATLAATAIGGLLLDLGKVAVPVPILAKPAVLSTEEELYVRRHVERGLGLVAGARLPARAIEMIATHHEHLDGSGYPARLSGTRIPLFGRIAAIADAYDAMTLNRRYAAAQSPWSALRQLEAIAGDKLDAALVDELIQALGTWPAGTLVELADGCVGLVQAAPPMRTEVRVTHDAERRPLASPLIAAIDDSRGIIRALPPHAVQAGRHHPGSHAGSSQVPP